MRQTFLVIFATLCLAGCGGPSIRIVNGGDVTLEKVTMIYGNKKVDFGNIMPGGATDFRAINTGLHAVKFEAGVADGLVTLGQFEYAPNAVLLGNKHTFELTYHPDVTGRNGRLELTISGK